jgi:hypothetical protein
MNHKPFLISPLDKGYQTDTVDGEDRPQKTGHTSRKNAVNSIMRKIPASHQILITDMGECNAKD